MLITGTSITLQVPGSLELSESFDGRLVLLTDRSLHIIERQTLHVFAKPWPRITVERREI